jgi:UDP-2,3-diacylglucosamine hydrolase
LSATTDIYFVSGNRDFLIGKDFFKSSNITPLSDITQIEMSGQEALIMHGDTLCTDDTEYQEYRIQVHSNEWKNTFLKKPVEERLSICNDLREKSEEAKKNKQEYIMDVNSDAVHGVFRDNGYPPLLIHGHTHRLNTHDYRFENHVCQRWVLGDWHKQGNYIVWNSNEIKFLYLD